MTITNEHTCKSAKMAFDSGWKDSSSVKTHVHGENTRVPIDPSPEKTLTDLTRQSPNCIQNCCLRCCGDGCCCCCCSADEMERESKAWKYVLQSCGHKASVWDLGGIRYKACGTERRILSCPVCGQISWATLIYQRQDDVESGAAMQR